jgi:hypothetical protein
LVQDFSGARQDLQRCTYVEESRLKRLHAILDWIEQGAFLFASEIGWLRNNDDELWSWLATASHGAARGLTRLLPTRRMDHWDPALPLGTKVRVLEDANELRRLCERPAPGADKAVNWATSMMYCVGLVGSVSRTGTSAFKAYGIVFAPGNISFSFPFDTLYRICTSSSPI